MRVAVVGAGTIGLTTAYFLNDQGASVSVFDSAEAVATEASFANGGQLSYSFADGMATPAMLLKLPRILLRQDPAIRARPHFSPRFLSWGLQFLWSCLPRQSDRSASALLDLALRSQQRLADLHECMGTQYAYRRNGKLVLLNNAPSTALLKQIEQKRSAGCAIELVSAEQAETLEPALRTLQRRPSAAIYGSNDAVGDARTYAQCLSTLLANRGACLRLGSPVQSLVTANNIVSAVTLTDGSTEQFDAVVVCTGGATHLLSGLKLPASIYPVTGYSLTLPVGETVLDKSLTLLDDKIVLARLGEHIRIAGMADINWPSARQPERIRKLLDIARTKAPHLACYPTDAELDAAINGDTSPACSVWTGHRPMTPSGLPLTGETEVSGLFLNLGHGMLGWTLAGETSAAVASAVRSSLEPAC